jgi:hypothetical protein
MAVLQVQAQTHLTHLLPVQFAMSNAETDVSNVPESESLNGLNKDATKPDPPAPQVECHRQTVNRPCLSDPLLCSFHPPFSIILVTYIVQFALFLSIS